MRNEWRLLIGPEDLALHHQALDAALVNGYAPGESANVLRLYRHSDRAVAVGYHQIIEQEVRTEYCAQRDIAVVRRITGGGALYIDPDQLHWSVIADRVDFAGEDYLQLCRRLGEAVARALRELGVEAVFRPRNDIEVGGRKIGGLTGRVTDQVILFQGSLLLDVDVETMLTALKVPTEKLTPEGLDAARDRVTRLRDHLADMPQSTALDHRFAMAFAEALGLDARESALTAREHALWRPVIEGMTDETWTRRIDLPASSEAMLTSVVKRPGGVLRIAAAVDAEQSVLTSVAISGDFNIQPFYAVTELEQLLRDTPFPQVRARMRDFFAQTRLDLGGLTEDDLALAVRLAIEKVEYRGMDIDLAEANAVFPINVPEGKSVEDVLRDASVFLLPYCAKLPECKFRFTQGCSECGMCTIGDAYRLARERNMEAVTIIRFEHLKATLEGMKQRGVKSYVGACCEEFYVKRQQAFLDAGLPGVLLDIDGKTCYALRQEGDAYAGKFQAQADLKSGLVGKVLRQIPIKVEGGPAAKARKHRDGAAPAARGCERES